MWCEIPEESPHPHPRTKEWESTTVHWKEHRVDSSNMCSVDFMLLSLLSPLTTLDASTQKPGCSVQMKGNMKYSELIEKHTYKAKWNCGFRGL